MALSDLFPWSSGDAGDRVDPAVEWRDRVDDLLLDGETVEGSLEFENGTAAVVTNRRLLAFEPDLEGANFERVDRPNVESVATGALSESGLVRRAVQWGLLGGVCVGAGLVVGIDAAVAGVDLPASGGAEQVGLGGLTGFVETTLDLLALLDDALVGFGVLFAAYAGVLALRYTQGRDRTLVIEVAGSEDVHLTRPAQATDARARLEGLLGFRPDPVDDGGSGEGTGGVTGESPADGPSPGEP